MDDASLVAGVLLAALIGFFLLARQRQTSAPSTTTGAFQNEPGLTLLFKDGVLIDAQDPIWPILELAPTDQPSWDHVQSKIAPFVPDFPLHPPSTSLVISNDTGPEVEVQHLHRCVRITLRPVLRDTWFEDLQDTVKASRLTPAMMQSPNPIWYVTTDESTVWRNTAFVKMAEDHGGTHALAHHVEEKLGPGPAVSNTRISLSATKAGPESWFEILVKDAPLGKLFYATSVDAVVRAEEAQRNFVQTLSKTFANLTTGLAIFDRNRRLALFNPALIDLCGLSAEFLSSRPNLFEFFDKLREKHFMPEPKNYDNWRECMAKLVADANDDRFRETWNLANSQTFDVIGRPYPDGAIAFLFNDITAEVTLTRGFRTELETMQASLDAMEDAVAVFSQQGVLTITNAAYKAMWNVDPDTSLTEATIVDATQEWKTAFHPAPIWPELRDYIVADRERASWDNELRAKDGRHMICRVDPICYGATIVRFCLMPARQPQGEPIERLKIVSA